MKILITGGAGYVGSACLRHVAAQGHRRAEHIGIRSIDGAQCGGMAPAVSMGVQVRSAAIRGEGPDEQRLNTQDEVNSD